MQKRSYKTYMKMDVKTFQALPKKEQGIVFSAMADAANKRLRTLEKYDSPAADRLVREAGKDKITGRGRSLNSKAHLFKEMQEFFGKATSTGKGARRYTKMHERAGRFGTDVEGVDTAGNSITSNRAWKAFRQFLETHPAARLKGSFDSDDVVEFMLFEMDPGNGRSLEDMTTDEIRDQLNDFYDKNSMQPGWNQMDMEVENPFTMGY